MLSLKISKTKFIFLTLVCFFILFGFASSAEAAQTKYWVGSAGGNTSVVANWSTAAGVCTGAGNGSAFTTGDILIFTSSCVNDAVIDSTLSVTIFTLGAAGNVYSGTITQNATTTVTGTFSQAGGTFTGGSLPINFGSFTLTNGTFNSTSGVLSITGNAGAFTHTAGGTFNEGTGTVTMSFANQTINANTEEFNNLNISQSVASYYVAITTATSITVNGTLTQTKGLINTGTINAKGPVIFASGAASSANSATINVNGTTDQAVTFGGGTTYVPNIVLNNALATVTYNGTTTMASLTLTNFSGTFDLGTYPLTVVGAFSQATSTFTGGTNSISMGSFTLTNGTFNSTSGILTIAGNNFTFTHTAGGTFNHNNGTLKTLVYGTINAPNDVFYNLNVSNQSSILSLIITTATSITVNGTLTQTLGTILTGTINVKGNYVIASGAATTANSATININGTTTQSVTFGGGTGYVPNITLNNTLATVTYNGTTTMASLTLTNFSGSFDTNNYPMTVTGAFSMATGTFIGGSGVLTFGSLTINGGTFDLNGGNVAGAGTFTVGAAGTMSRWGNELIKGTVNGAMTLSEGSTIIYDDPSVPRALPNYTYKNLVINSAASTTVYTLGANLTVSTTTITSGKLYLGGYNFISTSTTIGDSGVLQLKGNETVTIGSLGTITGTVEYVGDADSLADIFYLFKDSYPNLKINLTDVVDTVWNALSATSSVSLLVKDFSVLSGISVAGATTTVTGNWSQSGTSTFNANGGTVVLNGVNQFITGTTTFANLVKTVTSADTLTFGAGQTTTATGTVTLQGTNENLLSLRSNATGTQWLFDPQGVRSFSYLDVQDSWNIGAEIDSTAIDGFVNSLNNTGWGSAASVLTVSATGTQQSTTTLPVTNKYLGGAFTLTKDSGTSNVTGIVLTQHGSLPTINIDNVRLHYKETVDGLCSTSTSPAGTTLFGTAGGWSNNRATTTNEGVPIPISATSTCIYVQYDLVGTTTEAILLDTVDFEVENPSTDIISDATQVSPSTRVNISGSTVVRGINDAGDCCYVEEVLVPDTFGSWLVLDNADDTQTKFYVKNGALYMQSHMPIGGSVTPQRLTMPGITVSELTMTPISPSFFSFGRGGVKITLKLSKQDITGISFKTIERTFNTTATVQRSD
jgi:hypothetical protein